MRSEDDFLALIDVHFPREHGHVVLGRGDDCAILHMDGAICLSTDLFLEDVHFRRRYFSPQEIGHKALAVNVSDIAAMGGQPLGFSLGLMAPPGLPQAFWDALFAGMASHAAAQGVALTGGDLSAAPLLGFSVTVWGRPAPAGTLLRRGPVQPGDRLVVIGPPGPQGTGSPEGNLHETGCAWLGLARQGLRLLEAQGRAAMKDWPACTAAHLTPEPQTARGLKLAAIPGVHGCMDISDGLARDLPRLLAFGQPAGAWGAKLTIDAAMLHPELLQVCTPAQDPVREAVLGGEDYALLAAVDPAAMATLRAALPEAVDVGEVVAEPGLLCNGQPLSGQGFDHFSRP